MLGLEWKDIDFESEIISIHRTSNYTAEFGVYTDTTKTKKSQRTLKVAHQILEILNDLKAEQQSEEKRLGSKWNKTDRLFTTWDGHDVYTASPEPSARTPRATLPHFESHFHGVVEPVDKK